MYSTVVSSCFSTSMNFGIFPYLLVFFLQQHFIFPVWDQSQMDTVASSICCSMIGFGSNCYVFSGLIETSSVV
jgi:hypothetical protein